MVAIADSEGGLFYSVLQNNSNEHTTALLIFELTKLLEIEDAKWRENVVLILDNAPWHRTKIVRSTI